MLPTFLVIGAAKCGTTTLCARLEEHPDVFVARPREIHYFGRDVPQKTPAWYEEHFEGAEAFPAVGEGSTSYTHPDIIEAAADQIARELPAARLIYMVRHPIKRLESDWRMRRREGWAEADINQAVARRSGSLVTHGKYWTNLGVYRERFPDDQMLVVFLEDLIRDPEGELRRCLAHVGVDPDVPIPDPGRAENQASEARQDGLVAGLLRRTGVVDAARKVTPEPLFRLSKEVLTKEERYEAVWDPRVRERLWQEEFAGEAARLLEHFGKPADFWSIPSR